MLVISFCRGGGGGGGGSIDLHGLMSHLICMPLTTNHKKITFEITPSVKRPKYSPFYTALTRVYRTELPKGFLYMLNQFWLSLQFTHNAVFHLICFSKMQFQKSEELLLKSEESLPVHQANFVLLTFCELISVTVIRSHTVAKTIFYTE